MNTYVVEPTTHISELFDPVRLHGSIADACLIVRAHEGEAHLTAEQVCKKVIRWLSDKTEVTRNDIRRITASTLNIYHPEAAYMYENEWNII